MTRRLVLALVSTAVLLPAASAYAQDDGQPCPANNVTGEPTQSTIVLGRGPFSPGQPVAMGIGVDYGDPNVRPGSLVITVTGPDGTHELPSSSTNVSFTPTAEGSYTATGRYEVLTCQDPVQYAGASAGPTTFSVQKPPATQKVLPEDSGQPSFTVKISERSRVARKLGFLVPHRLPTGTRHMAVNRDRVFTGGPPGTPTPHGLFYTFDGGTRGSNPPQVWVFRGKTAALIKKVALAHDRRYKLQGGYARVSHFRAGTHSGTLITVGAGHSYGYVEWIFHAAGSTYLMTLPADNGHPLVRGVTARQIVASFA